jgi:hypothetical protein
MYISVYATQFCIPLPLITIADIICKIAYQDVEIYSSLSRTLVNPRPVTPTIPAASIRLMALSMITSRIAVDNGL